jgi:UDP-galactopyranose mutase
MNNKYDYLIVGCGFFGSTFARIATDSGKSCLIIDNKPHIAGAAYDKKWNNGIVVSEYGAHIFHTQSKQIWDFVNKFTEMKAFINKPKVLSKNKVYSFPINMMTMHQLWGVVTPEQARTKIKNERIPCNKKNPNFEEWCLDKIGRELYELFIYGYTKKQWMKEPKELPSSIIERLPIRFTYEENYFTTYYQGMPNEGYGNLIKNMLDGIKIELETDFFELDWEKYANHLVYTGPIDKFFSYEYGNLEYNTLKFEHKVFKGDFQGNAVFNHVDLDVPYIRSVEHKHFYKTTKLKHESLKDEEEETVVTYDIPISFKDNPEPYYPIRDKINSDLYSKYLKIKENMKNVTFGGRLGEYKYLDMDQTIASAISKAKKIINP